MNISLGFLDWVKGKQNKKVAFVTVDRKIICLTFKMLQQYFYNFLEYLEFKEKIQNSSAFQLRKP